MHFNQTRIRRFSTHALISIGTLGGLGFATAALGNTIHVCSSCAHTSIQSAVNDAASGDTIDVAAGRYSENITVAGKILTLVGQSAATTLVYGAARGPVFTLGSGATSDVPMLVTIQQLTISGGNHTGGTGVGGGIQVRGGAYLHLENSTLTANVASSGAGIGIDSPGAPVTTISGCLIDGNFTSAVFPGGPGGGIVVKSGSLATITGSIITRNTAISGGGVFAWEGSSLSITGSTIASNSAYAVSTHSGSSGGGGGGVEAHGAVSIASTYLLNNTASGEDGGGGLALYAAQNAVTTVSNTIIAQNSSGDGAGILEYGGTLRLENSYVVQNSGYGIWGNFTLVNDGSTVKDNLLGNICVDTDCSH